MRENISSIFKIQPIRLYITKLYEVGFFFLNGGLSVLESYYNCEETKGGRSLKVKGRSQERFSELFYIFFQKIFLVQ